MPALPQQGGSLGTWMTEIRNFFAGFFDLATGKLLVGSGTAQGEMMSRLSIDTTTVGTNAATSEKDLSVYSLPLNSLSADGKAIKVRAWGTTGANANNKSIRLYFGSTVIASGLTLALNAKDWVIEGYIVRTSAAVEKCIGSFTSNGAAPIVTATPANAQDTTAAITIKVTGQNGTATANDIVCHGMSVEFSN